ncbi:MAG: ATP-binding protein [Planctomycetota bacterium]
MVSEPAISRSIVVESKASSLEKVYNEVFAHVQANHYSCDDIFGIHLSMEEAFVNAVKHGNRADATKKIKIDYSITAEKVEISITDEGNGFDPRFLPDPRVNENIYKPGGRGVLLIRSFMDLVEYNRKGNCVRMVKYRGSAHKSQTTCKEQGIETL